MVKVPLVCVEIHPQGAGRRRDDAGKRRQAHTDREARAGYRRSPRSARRRPRPKTMRATAMLDRTMSAKTKAAKRKIARQPPRTRFRRLQRRERPAADKGDAAAQENLPQRKRLVEQQPQDEQAGAHERKGQQPRHVSPTGRRPLGRRAKDATNIVLRRVQRLRRGLHEAHDRAGLDRLHCAKNQKDGDRRHLDQPHAWHGPIRRGPERTDAGARHGDEGRQSRQDQHDKQNPGGSRDGTARRCGLSAAVSSANLAMNPESGGRPEMTRAQPMKGQAENAHGGRNRDADFLCICPVRLLRR